jgi:hypothetical protein
VGALEREASEPSGNGLGDIAIKVDKVLGAAVKLNDPVVAVVVHELALGSVGELGELSRGTNKASVANGGAGEEVGDGVRSVVSDNGGIRVDTGLVVEDADGDLVGSSWGSGDATGEGQDGGSEDGGELHVDGVVWDVVLEVSVKRDKRLK